MWNQLINKALSSMSHTAKTARDSEKSMSKYRDNSGFNYPNQTSTQTTSAQGVKFL